MVLLWQLLVEGVDEIHVLSGQGCAPEPYEGAAREVARRDDQDEPVGVSGLVEAGVVDVVLLVLPGVGPRICAVKEKEQGKADITALLDNWGNITEQ